MIVNNHLQSVTKAYAENKPVKNMQRDNKALTSKASQKDEVILSTQAQSFSQLLQKAKTMPAVREDRVAQVSAELDAGKYQVNAAAIAEKMLNAYY